jgi:hypothetical protein
MKVTELVKNNKAKWMVFGRDADKPDLIIDTNQYMIVTKYRALLMDPGGI